MKKVVYNNRHGGFNVSREAMVYLLMLGFPLEKRPFTDKDTVADFPLQGPNGIKAHHRYSMLLKDGYIYHSPDCSDDSLRSHPALVKTVELLGDKANGDFAQLTITELPTNAVYRIEEYDGLESVSTPDITEFVPGFEMTDVPLPPELQISSTASGNSANPTVLLLK